ncbi:MAG: DUF1571 domain-containing protein [Gemmatales bacterium]|nr:DUF1571 domain-containing protein [Gemmatales bacterium]
MPWKLILACGLAVAVGLTAWCLYEYGRAPGGHNITQRESTTNKNQAIGMERALEIIEQAQQRLADIRDYRCQFLRKEFIDSEWKRNHVLLRVRHAPFSVYMEWLSDEPTKRGRKVVYHEHLKDKMRVRIPLLGIVREMDLESSIRMKESRYTVAQAGIKNLTNRLAQRWQREQELGLTKVEEHEVDLEIQVGTQTFRQPCTCIMTLHPSAHRETFQREGFLFHRTYVYFAKDGPAAGLPIQLRGYDWPQDGSDGEGPLVEESTYFQIECNLGLNDKDFEP